MALPERDVAREAATKDARSVSASHGRCAGKGARSLATLPPAGPRDYTHLMISDLLNRLLAPAPDPLPQADARLALAALLVRVARSDGEYAAVEISRIDALLADRYGLLPGQAKTLRAQAEALEAQAPDTVRFTRAIKDSVDHDDRLDVVEALWDIVLADGARDEDEDALMRLVAPMLGINDRDSNLARRRVEAMR